MKLFLLIFFLLLLLDFFLPDSEGDVLNGPFDVVVAVRDVAVDGLERDDLQLLKILESKNPEDCIDRWPCKTAKVEN